MSHQSETGTVTAGLSGTLDPRHWRRPSQSVGAVPALTVLFHPDVGRVGDRRLLSEIARGQEALVGRYSPEFSSVEGSAGRPLNDTYISRRPVRFQPAAGGGLVLSLEGSRTRVEMNGVPVLKVCEVPASALERGVVLELSGRVVLLLHRCSGRPAEAAGSHGLVGESEGIVRVRAEIRQVADLEVPLLLRGETGTGKELVARAVHGASPRRDGPFVAINLGAIPPSLIASELFGTVKGAYTGAVQSQEGYFRRAHGGILFLDEVGEAPLEVQVMLLRALETGEIYPVGSQTPVRVDVRVLAATDADLELRVRAGEFRAPLLHRLSGYQIWMPPLRERRDDLGLLLVHFLRRELEAIGETHRLSSELWVPAELVARLARFDWPGNVRQLRNVVRQLAIGSRGLPRIESGPAVERILQESPGSDDTDSPAPASPPAPASRRRPAEISQDELVAALRASRWDLQATAEQLRISRPSLYALIESSTRVRKAGDLSADEISRCFESCGGDLDAMVDRLEVSRKALARRLRELKLG